ncbi:MAG: DUF1801 domain-containing protein [Pseudomonadota bacterium]
MDKLDPNSIHADFERILSDRPMEMQFLYRDVRGFVIDTNPTANEFLYHTHALSSVYSLSRQLKHAYCHIVVYSRHINLGFNSGTSLEDPDGLLQGTGARIRHVPIQENDDLSNPALAVLLRQAIEASQSQLGGPATISGETISKIKTL